MNDIPGSELVDGVPTLAGLETVFGNIIGLVLGAGGVVLFVLLIVGGFKYLTSSGNPQEVEGAKKIITSAIIGVVVLIMAFLILRFIEVLTGANVSNFQIKVR